MAKKTKRSADAGARRKTPKKPDRTAGGLGHTLAAGVTWFVGDFSRENGLDWLKNIAIAVALALLIRWALTEPYQIPSQSMYPTLNGDPRLFRGDRVFINKFVYGLRVPFMNKRLWRGADPKRWDIVVFHSPEPHAKHGTLIKRIVGLPGERIHIAHGKIYVNGKPLKLPPNMPPIHYTSPGEVVHVVDGKAYIGKDLLDMPPDETFSHDTVLGGPDMVYGILKDNFHAVVPPNHYLMLGDNSVNSRDGRYFGWVPNRDLIGRAYCIWWPIGHWRDLTGFSRTWWWRTVVSALGALALARLFLGRSWQWRHSVLGDTLRTGEHLYIHRCALGIPIPLTRKRVTYGRALRRGEIVVYHAPPDNGAEESVLAGRVVGLPGERVYLENGRVLIDGAPLSSPPSLADQQFNSDDGAGPYGRSRGIEYSGVPEGHYYILCNDSGEYPDSRRLGWIARRDIIGPATAVWWPLWRWRKIREC